MKTLKLTTSALLISSLLMGGIAQASDRCDNFTIKVNNQSGYQVKVTKVEYYDYDKNKWRSESLTQQIIQDNVVWSWNRNLEYVDNDLTKLKITYKEKYGGAFGGYSNDMTRYSGQFTCKDNGSQTVTLN